MISIIYAISFVLLGLSVVIAFTPIGIIFLEKIRDVRKSKEAVK